MGQYAHAHDGDDDEDDDGDNDKSDFCKFFRSGATLVHNLPKTHFSDPFGSFGEIAPPDSNPISNN